MVQRRDVDSRVRVERGSVLEPSNRDWRIAAADATHRPSSHALRKAVLECKRLNYRRNWKNANNKKNTANQCEERPTPRRRVAAQAIWVGGRARQI